MSDAPRTMIEDYIPVDAISRESVREKLGGHQISRGMPRNIHLWWARRPLAAARAAIYATFAPPATGAARERLGPFFESLCHWSGPVLIEHDPLREARAVVSTAASGQRPKVLDMFAGGGAIPLEALRLGADAVALDLNPVAHLIQLCTLVYPQKYGARLRDAVEKWGTWVIEQTKKDVGDLYPDIDVEEAGAATGFEARRGQLAIEGTKGKKGQLELGETTVRGKKLRPIAYLWTRTIPSPARGYEKGQVPLVRQTWLRKKKGNYVAAKPIVDREKLAVRYEIVESSAKSEKAAIEEWGFDPDGSNVRGSTTCPFSGTPVTAADAKKAGKQGLMGELPIAVVVMEPGRKRGKRCLPAQSTWCGTDAIAIEERIAALAGADISVPTEALPRKLTGGMCSVYGLDTFDKLFTPRQKLFLLTLCKHVRDAHARCVEESGDAELAQAIGAYLGLLVGRVADRGSTLCRWEPKGEKTVNTYARQALPMVWDFCEAAPLGGASGDAKAQLAYILEVIEHCVPVGSGAPAVVLRGRAQRLPLGDESIDAVVTDPPYYDNISYADLSDFFYVWHKRALGSILPELYGTDVTPKKPEAVVARHRHGGSKERAAEFYEAEMHQAFLEAHRVLKPDASMVVVYAHKTTLGWSTLIDSLRRAGFTVTEAWPLDTERPDRAGQMNTASLASSIFIATRKRPRSGVGNYATEVRPEMARIVEQRVRDLMNVGISGADLVIACVGAGLRPFTRYDRVELPNGDELGSARFLEEVQREVLDAILAAVFEVDRSGVSRVDKASRFYVLGRYQYGAAKVDFGEANVMAQGLGIELSGPASLTDGKRALVESVKGQVRLRDYTERGALPGLGEPSEAGPASLVDVLHRLLWLLDNDRTKVGPFLDAAQSDTARLRLLANALKGRALAGGEAGEGRTEEQKTIDRLLAQWSRVVEERAMPLLSH